jgi:hypothetical protein
VADEPLHPWEAVTQYEELREALFGDPLPCCAGGHCAEHQPQPGDDELGRALLGMFADMVVARCADPGKLWRGIRP